MHVCCDAHVIRWRVACIAADDVLHVLQMTFCCTSYVVVNRGITRFVCIAADDVLPVLLHMTCCVYCCRWRVACVAAHDSVHNYIWRACIAADDVLHVLLVLLQMTSCIYCCRWRVACVAADDVLHVLQLTTRFTTTYDVPVLLQMTCCMYCSSQLGSQVHMTCCMYSSTLY